MKAAGISLFKIMKSLIILIALVSVGSFYFANNILPVTQVRMWGLLFSIREASPELDIPQGAFYDGIKGRNTCAADPAVCRSPRGRSADRQTCFSASRYPYWTPTSEWDPTP